MHLDFYISTFRKLRRDQKNGGAPHKPILLLSVIHLFEQGIYDSNKVYFIPELVSTFKAIWSRLVDTDSHHPNIALPFSHMRSEPFWQLIPNEGCERWIESKASMRSFKNLKMAVDYALIDTSLSELLKDSNNRHILFTVLTEKYFPKMKFGFFGDLFYRDEVAYSDLVNDSAEEYRRKILELKLKLDEDSYEEEVFVRNGLFKREIAKIYDNTCSISSLRIVATTSISMIDGCHIVPFSKSYNDTLTNGIALCPNLHRAFDRGLISLDDQYRVLVSRNFTESESDYSIRKYEGKEIILPQNENYIPDKENIRWHREHIFDT